MSNSLNEEGQTAVEYILILCLIVFFGIPIFKGGMKYLQAYFLGVEDTILRAPEKVESKLFYKYDLFSVEKN